MNIIKMMMAWPRLVKLPVKPRDKPTVPSADMASKTISINGAFSLNTSMKMASQDTTREMMVSAKALLTVSLGISRLNT